MSRWVSIMTTSMNTPSNPLAMGVLDGAPGNLPDVGELTRLANEFYSTPPGYSTPPAARVTGKPSSGAHVPPTGIGESAAWSPWSSSASSAFETSHNVVPGSAAAAPVPPSFVDHRPAGIPSEVPG